MFDYFFRKIAPFIMSKNIVETVGPHITLQYGTYALCVGLARLYARMRTHTQTNM